MKLLKAFGQFWYEFIIGEDWKVAAAVSLALALLVAAMRARLLGDHGLAVMGGAMVVVFFAASLAIDVRRTTRGRVRQGGQRGR
ncbi:MAG: hypothetical protein QOE19_3363 [Actinomycetota bacterium]|jgi:hypothetical protein|nr:hypothetical protein [Actinomycetota bacterium]MDQ1669950.1 hypothetical protein [Actinomycetota bacterium]